MDEDFDDYSRKERVDHIHISDQIEKIGLSGGNEVIVAGIAQHTTSLSGTEGIMNALGKVVQEKGAEDVVFLGEGSAVTVGVIKKSLGEAILGGDQQAMAYRAKELGIKQIDSWDMSMEEQLATASSSFGAENALLWMVSQSAIHLNDQGQTINMKNILQMLNRFGMTKEKIVNALGDPNISKVLESEETIDRFLITRAGFSLTAVNTNDENYRQLSQVAFPSNTDADINRLPEDLRVAATVGKGLSEERDKRFVQKIKQYSEEGKTMFVSCGGGHVDSFSEKLQDL
ncbi:MAG: hypothetical protein UT19_C0007G0081 [Candidatus Woesebacteria bacterium GW2011_GWB1_39_10b]|uniref:Uncharacterized protein n=3 Tax=Candidatus Woeseibacteriota TaxID=1752722 RepID=A0A0G0QSB4_9BACT|nr:MAG: hypothetical protein US72_C0008G0038 [Microgenomates group bacterium GW2011_GWC1_38_12]KKQ93837.1 MAG: hypothetical protein UT19_C0007G0081 [Candidatus Woesebacteria bacterium GW2011_GWB1_39_10b]KKR13255.1 MAG: hypothetical protein UT40_C0021G0037 [Candidatus Woesebacteria bacterium GW2011_GWA1_39_21b]OGM64007.1 MAG: hypothetical protein A3A52_04980 [Candidatus Woesebacteria bacterium RIFCSPLOWO2_01_FULL_39_14]